MCHRCFKHLSAGILLQLPFQLHVQRHGKIRDLLRGSEVLSERQSETGLTFNDFNDFNGEKISIFSMLSIYIYIYVIPFGGYNDRLIIPFDG